MLKYVFDLIVDTYATINIRGNHMFSALGKEHNIRSLCCLQSRSMRTLIDS